MKGTQLSADMLVEMGPETRSSTVRFGFGRNWKRFLKCLNDERIAEAEKSLRAMLQAEYLQGMSFLDIGCGSGLFSLAAMRLGADRVCSFDFDPQSVACTQELKRRYFDGASGWTIQEGSVLDSRFLSSLGQFEIVYSWGVLHHTGNMWQALEKVAPLVSDGGKLFIALYNDQGIYSSLWKTTKKRYNSWLGWRLLIVPTFVCYFVIRGFVNDTVFLRRNPLVRYREFQKSRGMAFTTDMLDWLGGYPFEVAKPDAVFDFFRAKGFELVKLKTAGIGSGNNEFVFVKCAE
jgi:2-polyprenyl-6-hydroxyphenyl methylase/3-demethylubiquinone-9 3-methyltransferase